MQSGETRMGKYVATEFDELVDSINPKIKALRNQLKSYEGSGQKFVDMDSFKGSGAENAKDYYHSAQIPAAKTFSTLAGDIQKKAKKIQDDFRDNVDANSNAVYDSDFLEDYLSKGKANKKALNQTIREINAAIESSGSERAEKLKPSALNDYFDEWEKEVKKAKEKFDDFRLDNANTWESLENRTDSFQTVIKGFAYSKQHGGAAAYSGKTKSMLKTAIRNAKPVSEVEKESGIKKPKNMSEQKYKALVSRAEEAMAHAPKSVKGKKAKQLYKQYLASQLAEAKQKDWDKTVKAVNETAENDSDFLTRLKSQVLSTDTAKDALQEVAQPWMLKQTQNTFKSVASAKLGAGLTAREAYGSALKVSAEARDGIGKSFSAGGKLLGGVGIALDAKGTYDSGKAQGLDDIHAAEYSGAKTASKVVVGIGLGIFAAALFSNPVGWAAVGISVGVSLGASAIVDVADNYGAYDKIKGKS